jgi:pSer/pThr/pTyr-binding forkhead associated (FHA) protein
MKFNVADLPVYLGRDDDAQFIVQDPRVSEKHAVIEWRTGNFYLKILVAMEPGYDFPMETQLFFTSTGLYASS